jgi:hypothetical protein
MKLVPDMTISDVLSPSPKIIASILANIPVVSGKWVSDCIKEGYLFDPTPYVLISRHYLPALLDIS